MRYQFLIDTYQTERLKVLSVWSMFQDQDLPRRPHATDRRGRSVLEHMVHQCMSENNWFRGMLGIDVGAPPLPSVESRDAFLARYAEDSLHRLEALSAKEESWWEQEVSFFDVRRSRAWVMVRRIAHTAHHRGQQMAMLRMLNRDVYSNYGPTADTGGLAQNGARTLYAYPDAQTLLDAESRGGEKAPLPGPGADPITERP
ncbi:MAG TPA: DinB family protein [Bryobacteraceae bacterium]|nr:DinB family protein [Bryobacteraceae bacterium]